MMEQERTLIRQQEVMQVLGIGRTKFYELTRQKDFPSLKIGRYVYVDRNRLNEWISKQIEQKVPMSE